MPLIKSPSKKAFEHNLKAEMQAGKPQKQVLAIAYSVKRKQADKKKYAEGGMTEDTGEQPRSIAEAIMAKQRQAMEPIMKEDYDDSVTEDFEDTSVDRDDLEEDGLSVAQKILRKSRS